MEHRRVGEAVLGMVHGLADVAASRATWSLAEMDLEQAMQESAWGKVRYRPESDWNLAERRAYLRLLRRDMGSPQSFQVTIRDPKGERHQTNPMAMADHFVCIYPDDFPDIDSVAAGAHKVIWSVMVGTASGPKMRKVARHELRVPTS